MRYLIDHLVVECQVAISNIFGVILFFFLKQMTIIKYHKSVSPKHNTHAREKIKRKRKYSRVVVEVMLS